jgi:hypothetical protein
MLPQPARSRVSGRERVLGAEKVRWSHVQANPKQPSIGKLIDEAMGAIRWRIPT